MRQIYHKIRGSHPGYIGIELPNETEVILLDEENFNLFRKSSNYNGTRILIKDQYCHFLKPTHGSWHIVIEGRSTDFKPEMVNIIYKAA
ncbi:DUF1883 domain-containing protein [Acidiluteibacter ferrifornacis]|uniref:DUF1883 domain-containing protein n=1 Tax=Acidiluteibacter ferrifornacis TaxID=2692424 RepID=A0A6N9NGL7_9FLAO|nr:DUF1883 domain-containing protein [Acidiluteibacter ferrifornacis]MBR9830936.1 DUF1883 domain-containing protein [bacterium]NBG64962.1 DUF1883 domain-containing protein [Acidiluteibacter ferrifornacis]